MVPPNVGWFEQAKRWAKSIKRDVIALWLAARDPRVPWYAKVMAGAVAAYALSPLDLIPDFIPVLGYVDDLFILPIGILVVRLIPPLLMAEFRVHAEAIADRPTNRLAAALVVAIWVAVVLALGWWLILGSR